MKVFIENAILLSAEIKDNLKLETKEGKNEWVKAGGQKVELTIMVDVTNDLSTGSIKTVTSAKSMGLDCANFVKSLHRYDKLDVTCQLVELKDRNTFVFYNVKRDGQDISTPFCVQETDEKLPF